MDGDTLSRSAAQAVSSLTNESKERDPPVRRVTRWIVVTCILLDWRVISYRTEAKLSRIKMKASRGLLKGAESGKRSSLEVGGFSAEPR